MRPAHPPAQEHPTIVTPAFPLPTMGGGWPVIQYWAEHTLSPEGPQLWQKLMHKSACLPCAWGTGGQKGGFHNELDEPLQRCMKSVEAIAAELQPAVAPHFFATHSLADLQQLTSREADRLGRLSFPVIWRAGQSHYERLSGMRSGRSWRRRFGVRPVGWHPKRVSVRGDAGQLDNIEIICGDVRPPAPCLAGSAGSYVRQRVMK